MKKSIIDIYKEWDRDKDYLNLNLKILRKLTNLNSIANDKVFDKINSVAYFLQSNNYEKPQIRYLTDLKNIVNSFVMIDKYFQSQKAFNIELSRYYRIPTIDNSSVWRELNQDTIKKLNTETRNEQKAFYSMVREIYQYGIIKGYKDNKIKSGLDKLGKLPNFTLCNTSKSDSEIKRFFEMKYNIEKNETILKIGMQDLYNFFETEFSEYEPIDFCNEILKYILNEKPKQKRYFADKEKTTYQKIYNNEKNTYQISNIKK